jgi:hypothetical protein
VGCAARKSRHPKRDAVARSGQTCTPCGSKPFGFSQPGGLKSGGRPVFFSARSSQMIYY